MSLTERIKVEHLVRCACGVLAMDRASLPEPCQEHGELAVVEYVRADTYREAVEALRRIRDHGQTHDEPCWALHRGDCADTMQEIARSALGGQ
jgi:hypothetical protein